MANKILNSNLLALITFPLLVFYLFGLSIYGLISGVLGAVIIYILYSRLGTHKKSELGLDAILVVIGALALYLTTIDINFVSSFLI